MPLQKLYEKVYFDGFDLKAACAPFDNFEDETVTSINFERALLSNVESLSPVEANELSSTAPRLNQTYEHLGRRSSERRRTHEAARRELEQEIRIFYVRLANELNDLAALQIPCNLLYDRFDPTVEFQEPVDTRTAQEKESAATFSFQDPRL